MAAFMRRLSNLLRTWVLPLIQLLQLSRCRSPPAIMQANAASAAVYWYTRYQHTLKLLRAGALAQ